MCDYNWNSVFLLEYGKVAKYRAMEERMKKVHIVGGGAVENNQNRK